MASIQTGTMAGNATEILARLVVAVFFDAEKVPDEYHL